MTAVIKPPIPYFGGKSRIAEQVAGLLPAHDHYVEPFAGSLAVLLAKAASEHETVNDINGDLVNFWRVLRDRPGELERACALTPHSRAEYDASYDLSGADDLERARRTFVRLSQARSPATGRITGWRHHQAVRSRQGIYMPQYLANYAARVAPAAARLASVSLECLPALEVIARYGRHDSVLIYADPPYPRDVRGSGASYGTEMLGDRDHRELAAALAGCHAAVVLSGYDCPLYAELYDHGWYRREIGTYTGNGTGEKARTEVLWSSRPFPQGSLFDEAVAG